MRMTKRKRELLRLYQRERARGFQAKWALSNARTRLEWDKHEVAEYSSGEPIDPKRGNVRLRVVPDETCSLEDLEGDCFNPKANPDIPAVKTGTRSRGIHRESESGRSVGNHRRILRRGRWQHADSCFGFVGDDWKHSGYDTDIMRATLDEAKDARVCRCCGRPIVTKTDPRNQPPSARQKGSSHEIRNQDRFYQATISAEPSDAGTGPNRMSIAPTVMPGSSMSFT